MDRFGRKKIIVAKVFLCIGLLIPLIALGFVESIHKQVVFAFFFMSIFFSTFSFDLTIIGFEKLPKFNRENYIILLSTTRIIGIGIVCASFYFLQKWVYFVCIEVALLVIFIFLFMKFTFESPHHVLVSTASIDLCKYVLNNIAIVNEEDIITDKLAFSLTP